MAPIRLDRFHFPLSGTLRTVAWLVLVAAIAVLAVAVYATWGLRGSALLLTFWILFYAVSRFRLRRAQRRAREVLAGMTDLERVVALSRLGESDRGDILEALRAGEADLRDRPPATREPPTPDPGRTRSRPRPPSSP